MSRYGGLDIPLLLCMFAYSQRRVCEYRQPQMHIVKVQTAPFPTCWLMQGFIEGKYVPIQDGDNVPAGTEVLSAEEIAARKTGTTPKDPENLGA